MLIWSLPSTVKIVAPPYSNLLHCPDISTTDTPSQWHQRYHDSRRHQDRRHRPRTYITLHPSHTNLYIHPLSTNTLQNGIGAFLLPCRRLDLHYCDHWGSSLGMNHFLSSPLLPRLTTSHPSTEFRVSPRPNHHPVLKATYINGRVKAVCVRNMSKEVVMKRAQMLLMNDGRKNVRLGSRKVVSANESVRGVWSPLHGGLKRI